MTSHRTQLVAIAASLTTLLLAACADSAIDSSGASGDGGGGGGATAAAPKETPSVACARYVACVAEQQPASLESIRDSFGPRAACWLEDDAAKASCDDACRVGALALDHCAVCKSDTDCSDQGDASLCLRGACARPACASDARGIAALKAAACACDAEACRAEGAFVESLARSSSALACGPAFDAWARCEAASLVCSDGRVDVYAACDAELTALTECENAEHGAPCPPA